MSTKKNVKQISLTYNFRGLFSPVEFVLPISLSVNKCTVDWGDGTVTTNTLTHTFTPKIVTIVVVSNFITALTNLNNVHNKNLIACELNVPNIHLKYAFYGCSLLKTAPATLTCTGDISYMFYGASSFNQPLSGWDVSNATDMSYMFYNASMFNQPLSGWDVGKVTSMESMFNNALYFNQPLSNWDVSTVTNMAYMFYRATMFNQPLMWTLTNIENMTNMFAFTQLNRDNYDSMLQYWSVQMYTNTVITFMSNGLTYSNKLAHTNLTQKGWVIQNDVLIPKYSDLVILPSILEPEPLGEGQCTPTITYSLFVSNKLTATVVVDSALKQPITFKNITVPFDRVEFKVLYRYSNSRCNGYIPCYTGYFNN
jgi:surface protein